MVWTHTNSPLHKGTPWFPPSHKGVQAHLYMRVYTRKDWRPSCRRIEWWSRKSLPSWRRLQWRQWLAAVWSETHRLKKSDFEKINTIEKIKKKIEKVGSEISKRKIRTEKSALKNCSFFVSQKMYQKLSNTSKDNPFLLFPHLKTELFYWVKLF